MNLSTSEKERYTRQLIINGWGEDGQLALKRSTVFIAGAGGLGSPVAVYLAAAGVGTLRICDNGALELSNLNRQILYRDTDIGKNKVMAAEQTIKSVNPEVTVEPVTDMIKHDTAASIVGQPDIIVDCLDNFEARHVLNDYAVQASIPFVHAGIHGFSGQVAFFYPPETPCLNCVFPGTVPQQVSPVAGVTPAIIGSIEAAETLKWLLGIGVTLKNKLLIWDGETMDFQKIEIKKNPHCSVCSRQ